MGSTKKLELVYETAAKNKTISLDKCKIYHNSNIRKYEYKVGDRVLVNHPKVRKGLSSGLAFKFKGVFEMIGAENNGVDYVLKNINGKGKPFIMHKNRIKFFFGHYMENVEVNESPQTHNRPPATNIGEDSAKKHHIGEKTPKRKQKRIRLPKQAIKKNMHIKIPVRIQPMRKSKRTLKSYNERKTEPDEANSRKTTAPPPLIKRGRGRPRGMSKHGHNK